MISNGMRRACGGLLLSLLAASGFDRCELSTDSSTGELRIVVGTIERVDGPGGCWRLRAEDGSRYELRSSQAPDGVLRDGARVRLALRPRADLASACQVGTVADVERVLTVST